MLIALTFSTVGCEKDEIPIVYASDNTQEFFVNQLEMGADYRYRLYYDIESDSVVAFHQKNDWDLSFQCEDNAIRLNTSKLMSIYRTGSFDIENYTGFDGDGPLFDTSDGLVSGLAISTEDIGRVYVVDRGYDIDGSIIGYSKFSLEDMDDEGYLIRYGAWGETGFVELFIPREETVNSLMFSFNEGLRYLEPPKESWDLLFTHYTHFFDFYFGEENINYLVSGALLNPAGVKAAGLEDTDFEALDLAAAETLPLSSQVNTIGFDWKLIDIDTEVYTIQDNLYVVETMEGGLFKLQFTGFYNGQGLQGSPLFRAQSLK